MGSMPYELMIQGMLPHFLTKKVLEPNWLDLGEISAKLTRNLGKIGSKFGKK